MTSPNNRQVFRAAIIAAVMLFSSGLGQRWLERRLVAADARPVRLEQPLASLSLQVGGWRGSEIPLDQRVLKVAGCDDYVYRRYLDEKSGETVDLYVSYAARPAKMLGHRPQVCYPSHGWSRSGLRRDRFLLPDGTAIDCLIHYFVKPSPGDEVGVAVLNYYVLRGQYATEWTDFWGPSWRLPNLSRDPNFYVAQVQIVASVRDRAVTRKADEAVKRFASEIALPIRCLLPSASGF